jgi:hypothetical protein
MLDSAAGLSAAEKKAFDALLDSGMDGIAAGAQSVAKSVIIETDQAGEPRISGTPCRAQAQMS